MSSQNHKSIQQNKGTAFFVGDIHGQYDLFLQAMKEAGVRTDRGDRVYSVGDLVDRGPKNEQCLDLLNQTWFSAIMGNHEKMMLDGLKHHDERAITCWLQNGGGWGLEMIKDMYAGDKQAESLMQEIISLIDSMPYIMEVTTKNGLNICLVHSELPKDRSLAEIKEQLDENHPYLKDDLVWTRDIGKMIKKATANEGNWEDGLNEVIDPLYMSAREHQTKAAQDVDLIISGHTIMDQPVLTHEQLFMDIGAAKGNKPLILSEHQIKAALEKHWDWKPSSSYDNDSRTISM